jgi:hypothetical protein
MSWAALGIGLVWIVLLAIASTAVDLAFFDDDDL